MALASVMGAQAQALDFKPYARGSFSELRKAHAGRPLVIHFWSVTCAPCLAELSDWARIARERKGIDIVFVNVDGERDHVKAGARLEKAGLAGAVHYGFADDFLDRLFFEVDRSWHGDLPFTAMVDAKGALVTVTGPVDEPAIVVWLSKASP
ncbi:MAG TPA: TlpA disulfide reductase family protein [Methylocystis sp.]|nr:TlpA disulfide reductase family protein [Methylocystis sp.]